jgi:hypothetical protein
VSAGGDIAEIRAKESGNFVVLGDGLRCEAAGATLAEWKVC